MAAYTVNQTGSFSIERGFVRPEDYVKTSSENNTEKTSEYSNALHGDLKNFRLEVVMKHLSDNFSASFDLVLFSLSRSILGSEFVHNLPLCLTPSETLSPNWFDTWKTAAGTAFIEKRESLDLTWREMSSSEAWEYITALPADEKERLFSYCVASILRTGKNMEDDIFSRLGQRLDIRIDEDWRPTKKTFFGRVTISKMLQITKNVFGQQWADLKKNTKKGVLAETMETIFAGHKIAGITNEQSQIAVKWLPEGMAFDHDDAPVLPDDHGTDEKDGGQLPDWAENITDEEP